MTLEEARRIVADQDESDSARALEAVAVILRFEGIADARFLPIAERMEKLAAELTEGHHK
jgi:hypothetical protein